MYKILLLSLLFVSVFSAGDWTDLDVEQLDDNANEAYQVALNHIIPLKVNYIKSAQVQMVNGLKFRFVFSLNNGNTLEIALLKTTSYYEILYSDYQSGGSTTDWEDLSESDLDSQPVQKALELAYNSMYPKESNNVKEAQKKVESTQITYRFLFIINDGSLDEVFILRKFGPGGEDSYEVITN